MERIAIVGARIRVPGANTVDALWANLSSGRNSIDVVPADDPARATAGYVGRAGWVEGIEDFDHAFFGYSFREAQHLDPQQRLLLTLAHELCEDVGPPTRNVGVFASVGFPSYLIHNLLPARADAGLSSLGNSSHGAATRIAYKLGLTGPAFSLGCGCSSSALALHMARISILTGQCEMALVGGCSLRIPARSGYIHQRDGVLSEDGVCRPFDEHANGTVFTSGAVMVAVKKLSAALEHGDDIWCVVHGTAANNDGSAKAGFTAPSVVGQSEVIRRVYARAKMSPRSVGYLEAHGTGTALGDPIEVQALTEAFASFTRAREYCSLGSIKANLGHLDVAAGLMGVVKAGLCLEKRQIPPLANFSRVNARIDLAASPFYIQTETRPWKADDGEPRRAAVSSLGVGGTNVHLLLEEAPPRRSGLATRWGLIFHSARNPSALEVQAEAIAAAAGARPDQVGDLAYTSQLCPLRHATHGATFIDAGGADQDARPTDADLASGRPGEGVVSETLRSTGEWRQRGLIFAFPGQGTQYPGMGRELHAHVPAFRATFDHCAELFCSAGAADPRELLRAEGEAIAHTEVLQPYLFTVEHALGRVLLDLGLRPTAMLGHSLGEYVAATLAGVFDLATAVELVAARSRVMAAAPRGAMLVVRASRERAQEFLHEGVSLCVVNGAQNAVLGGTQQAIDALAGELERAGEKIVRLKTSHAFHSHLMDEAAADFERAFDGLTLREPQIPIVSNLDGRHDDPARFARPAYWAGHIRKEVRFHDCLQTIVASSPPPVVLELGPGRSIAVGLMSSFPDEDVAALPALAAGGERRALVGLIGQLSLNGVRLDRGRLQIDQPHGQRGRLTPMPRPALEPTRCWVDAAARDTGPAPGARGEAMQKREQIADWLYEPRWVPRTENQAEPGLDSTGHPHDRSSAAREVIVFSTSAAMSTGLRRALEQAGARVRSIDVQDLTRPTAPSELAALESILLERLGDRGVDRVLVVFAAGPQVSSSTGELAQAIALAVALTKVVRAAPREHRQLVLVGAHGVRTTREPLHWWNAWMPGFTAVASQEADLTVRYVDVDAQPSSDDAGERRWRALVADVILHGDDRMCALRGGLVWEREFRTLRPSLGRQAPPASRRVLILGGAGNVGLVHALHFLHAGATSIAIVSRDAVGVSARIAADDVPAATIWTRRRALIEAARDKGADLFFANADATSRDSLDRALDQVVTRFGGLDVVVQTSGAPAETHFRPFFDNDREHLETLIGAKLTVAQSLDRIARRLQIPRILVVSSISSVLGGLGLLGYAISHTLLDAYAAGSRDEGCHWTTVDWDAWDFYKQDRDQDALDINMAIDALAISEQEGLRVLGTLGAYPRLTRVIVSSGDLHRRYASWVLRTERRIALGERPKLNQDYVRPKGKTDRRLAELWGESIGIKDVGAHDNFFELGGDSLIALTLVERINHALETDITVMEIFKYPTIEKLGAWLDRTVPREAEPSADRTRTRGRADYLATMRRRRQGS